MEWPVTRRGVLAAALAGGTGAGVLSPANRILEAIAPMSGGSYRDSRDSVSGTVESPYGAATVTYDDAHVPHVTADSEQAAYYAVGYAQAADRLFQMDLYRRSARGRTAEVVGPFTAGQDVMNAKLDFLGAARASRDAIRGTEVETITQAYADGVTAYIESEPPGFEFGLLDYDPDPWSVLDTVLVGRSVSWRFSGGFGDIVETVRRDHFDDETYRRLFLAELDGDGVPAIREDGAPEPAAREQPPANGSVDPGFAEWLASFDPPDALGSNAWVVGGEYTESGDPSVCSDPHVGLRAPPTWYEQRVTDGERTVHGFAIPGTPVTPIGTNEYGAWGLTALQADVTDLYSYEVDDAAERYRYEGEWRTPETTTRTVPVRWGPDREVSVRKTVHGPLVEREIDGASHHVGVAWPGFAGGDLLLSGMYDVVRSEGLSSFRSACEQFGIGFNYVYGDRDGRTCYQVIGNIPVRRIDGEVVGGARVFDGSAGEGEWDGFVPFEQLPAAIDSEYVVTANQRPASDPAYPLGRTGFAPGARAKRLYERLDQAAETGTPMDEAFMRSLQLDTLDVVAREFVPVVLDARDRMSEAAQPWLDSLDEWDYRMTVGSRAALVYARFFEQLQTVTWADSFEAKGLSRWHWPDPWVVTTLPADSEYFDGDRGAAVAEAMDRAVEEIEDEGWDTYGDVSTVSIDHPIGDIVSGLNYPDVPVGGSGYTPKPYYGSSWGPGFRMVQDLGTDGVSSVLAGGNDGAPHSDHYHDQLGVWANGGYRRTDGPPPGDPDISFDGDGR
jgi:penicillin amidase